MGHGHDDDGDHRGGGGLGVRGGGSLLGGLRGIHAAKSGNRFEALEPIRQGVAERFAGLEADVAEGLKVRHDHGPAYLSDDFQREIAYLGMTSSPSFVRAPEGNGYCEWFIRILKENLLWVRSFATVEELRGALLEFKNLYNHH